MNVHNLKHLSDVIERDFMQKLPDYHKSRREGLCLLTSIILHTRTPNLMELASALPRDIKKQEKRYQYIERILSNDKIDVDQISGAYAKSTMKRIHKSGQTIILSMDQSHINKNNEVLMLAVRFNGRAVPFIWRVRNTKGGIGLETQEKILNSALQFIPKGAKVLLSADRFYGSAGLLNWLKENKWSYRIRMKKNILIKQDSKIINIDELQENTVKSLENVSLFGYINTNIGILHEKGHEEPWIIAMNCTPTKETIMDYSMRWSIESMFSDFKTRGFNISNSKIIISERLERLLLVMAMAMYCAISFGMLEKKETDLISLKKGFENWLDLLCLYSKEVCDFCDDV